MSDNTPKYEHIPDDVNPFVDPEELADQNKPYEQIEDEFGKQREPKADGE